MIVTPFLQVVATGQPRFSGCTLDGLPDEAVAIFLDVGSVVLKNVQSFGPAGSSLICII
jgi:hypothetical protein